METRMRTPPASFRILASLLLACHGSVGLAQPPAAAVAELKPTAGNNIAGTVRFTQQGDGVMVEFRVSGLKPGQQHGFHVHEKGDCSAADGMSTGGHFNPHGKPHGPQDGERHAGDLPSLMADSYGVAEGHYRVTGISLGSGAADIIGKGLIVHAQPDDYKTQPTGNAGARLACALITRAPA
jgi:Cu-Zn family superoxide dismutase